MPEAEKRYTIRQVGRALGLSANTVRRYVRLGIFPRPIRPYDAASGGYWLEDDLEDMRRRHHKMHRYRIPPATREEMNRHRKKK